MKKTLGLVLGVLGLAGLCLAQERLRVASYNVENLFDNYDDPYKPDEGTSPKYWEEIRRLGEVIDRLDADVLALQEVENLGIVKVLNDLLKKPFAYVEVLPSNDFRGIRCALLSRLPILRSISHRYQKLAGPHQFARDFPVFEVRTGKKQSLLVAPVHFKSHRSSKGDPESKTWRGAEARGVLRILKALRARGFGMPFVLLGDLNDTPQAETLAPLFAGLKDGTSVVPEEKRYSYVYRGKRQQIDHLLYDGDLRPKAGAFLHPEQNPSDHAPLYVDFAWEGTIPREMVQVAAGDRTPYRPRVEAGDLRKLRSLLLKEVEVSGQVVGVQKTRRGGHYKIRFAKDARRAVQVFVPGHAAGRFKDLEGLVGKKIRVLGPVFLYRRALEIQAVHPSQILLGG
jgi:endonuclease/exonuclease/phosphatase (EEP) superfamily protein YafD